MPIVICQTLCYAYVPYNKGDNMSKSIVLLPKEYDESVVDDIQAITQDKVIESTNKAFHELYAQCGSWDGWIHHIATGKDYLSQRPLYNKYYCVTEQLGRANADIVKYALDEGKTCEFYDGKSFHPITGVKRVSDDWSNGWELIYL